MSRDLTAGMITELSSDLIRPLVLVKFETGAGDLRIWNGIRDLEFNSEIYTGAGTLLEISGVQETQLLKAAGVEISLTGIDPAAIAMAFTTDYQGKPCTIWLGLLDAADQIIPDAYQQFKGALDVMTHEDDGVTAKISVTAQNELNDLERSRERRYTNEDQELDYPGDRFFDGVEGLQNKEIIQ